MKKCNLIARWKKSKRPYKFLRMQKRGLSVHEINMIHDCKRKLRELGIHMPVPTIKKIWFLIKDNIRSNVKERHVKISLLDLVFYWSKYDRIFSRLQVQPIGNLKKLFDLYKRHMKKQGFTDASIKDMRNTSLKGWREY